MLRGLRFVADSLIQPAATVSGPEIVPSAASTASSGGGPGEGVGTAAGLAAGRDDDGRDRENERAELDQVFSSNTNIRPVGVAAV